MFLLLFIKKKNTKEGKVLIGAGRGGEKEESSKGRKILLLQGKKLYKLLGDVPIFLEYVQFDVIHLHSVGGDVQHTGSRWRPKKDVPSGKETFT